MSKTFKIWMKRVSKIIFGTLDISLDDLPDENYRINYDAGMSVELMAEIVINNNQFDYREDDLMFMQEMYGGFIN